MKKNTYQAYIVAILAVLVRYYDYALFGLSAAILAKNFLPPAAEDEQLLAFFTIFALSVLARPLGSIIFGKIGDQFGRIISVKIATIVAAIATMLISLLPTYNYLGILAAWLLTFCRMLFIASLAGEVDGVRILVVEKAGPNKRILALAIISFSSQVGVLIASLMYYLAVKIDNSAFFNNDILSNIFWRINFALGGFCGLLVFLFRNHLQESDIFLQRKEFMAKKAENIANSIWQLIKNQPKEFFLATLLSGILGGFYNFLIIFLANFIASATESLTREQAALYNINLIMLYAVSCLLAGYLVNRFTFLKSGYLALMISNIVLLILCFFANNLVITLFLHKIIVFLLPFYSLLINVKIQNLFPIETRMRMCSLAHSLGSMIFSSPMPLISVLIWQVSANISWLFILLLILLSIIIYALSLVKEEH